MPITLLDALFIGLVLISAVLAMVRGFSREVLSIASWVAAAVAAFFFYRSLTPYVMDYVDNDLIAQLVSAGIIFLLALIIVTLITMRIADMIIDSRIGPLDRSLGFLFGAARGVIVAAVAVWFINFFVGDQQIAWIDGAKSKPFLDQVAEALVGLLPEDIGTVVPGGDTVETTDT
ncbi:MAG: CvpA family protein [Roseitalea porphyridii]|jgi:membrane protein required for colicin V production|uniref:CvpA family protein n=1 Tax=Roseitalea porphyridii TaxID=1852022 RepID=A0A4V1A3T8_9HYPH|nr:CvpA family protein [Roseitalea porphyridii]